ILDNVIVISPRNITTVLLYEVTATTEFYSLSLHDALPICLRDARFGSPNTTRDFIGLQIHTGLVFVPRRGVARHKNESRVNLESDRKSTRLNSSHVETSYAVFCL